MLSNLVLFPTSSVEKGKIFVIYWWFVYFISWNSFLGVRCPHKSPWASRVWRFLLIKLFSRNLNFELWTFSCRLTWERSTSGLWVVRTSLLMPVWSPFPSLSFPGLTGLSQVLRRIFLRAPRAAWHQVDRFRLRWNRWSWLCHWWTFIGTRLLTSLLTWRSAYRSD